MKKWLVGTALLLIGASAWGQSPTIFNSFTVWLSNLPTATLPFNSTDQTYIRQGGISKKTTITTAGRIKLSATLNLYADSVLGNNANSCLAPGAGNACGTVQGAFNKLLTNYDTAGQQWIINFNNTDTACLTINSAWTGGGQGFIIGPGGSPPSVGFSCAGNGVTNNTVLPANLTLRGFIITSAGFGIAQVGSNKITLDNMAFGANTTAHIYSVGVGARVECSQSGQPITFNGNAAYWIIANQGGSFFCPNTRIVMPGVQTYSQVIAYATDQGQMLLAPNSPFCTTYSGACVFPSTITGQRYNVSIGGLVDTQTNGAPNTIPGSIAGTNVPSGLYN